MGDENVERDPDGGRLPRLLDEIDFKTRDLARGANAFARAMSDAFVQSTVGGRNFETVLKSLALRLSDLSVRLAFKPIENGLSSVFQNLFGAGRAGNTPGDGTGIAAAMGAIKPFAAGGVIGTPTYFPLTSGGLGLAGEVGPEAIMPLTRGPDGRLGVAALASAPPSIVVNIATPDAESFRRSEAYLTGQIARAVARGQRSL